MAAMDSKEVVENWDDGDFDSFDNLHFRNASSTTTASARGSRQRESTGSRMSVKSDLDDDGDWQLLLANDDENSTKNAIENAKKKGIYLPNNIPPSALLGGTITKIGTRDSKRDGRPNPAKKTAVDWDEDLELPAIGGLKLKIGDGRDFPEQLRNVSASGSSVSSPAREPPKLSFAERSRIGSATISVSKLKDDDDLFFDDIPTVKVPKIRTIRKMPDFTPPLQSQPPSTTPDAFDADFDLPSAAQLKLASRSQMPKTPTSQAYEENDQDWAQGSHGSFGSISTTLSGTKHAGKSARSSSISARSPSIFSPTLSSCMTAESEDEGLEGLVLPEGPLDLGAALKKRTETASPELFELEEVQVLSPTKDDFLDGIVLGSGPVFDTNKLTLNRNIKQRPVRQTSPLRRPATSLTFINKPPVVSTRIPKPTPAAERSRPKLESVAESGAPLLQYRNTASRVGSHSQHNSVSGIPTPPTTTIQPSIPMPSTPSRRGLVPRASRDMLRTDSAQNNFLKNKRSLPVMSSTSRVPPSPARAQPPVQRPVSRQDRPLRTTLTNARPRTPVDRAESSLAAARRPAVYNNPTQPSQPRQLTKQSSRTFHRPTSSDSTDNASQTVRPTSRMSDRLRSNTPSTRRDLAPKSLVRVAATKRVTEPIRRRGYGDGTELDVFDDLPTSATSEAKFVKPAAGTAKISGTRRPHSGISQASAAIIASRSEAPSRLTMSPAKNDNNVPSFARSTAASRLAREQRLGPTTVVQAQRYPEVAHTPPVTNWKNVINSKPTPSPRPSKRSLASKEPPRRPQLINKIGAPITKGDHGMHWNEQLLCWEGNEAALAPFEAPASPKRTVHNPSPVSKPALIANVGTTKGVQVVGGMVFDPERMMWVKMSSVAKQTVRTRSDSLTNTTTTSDFAIFDLDLSTPASDDEDPFAGIADLADETQTTSSKSKHNKPRSARGGGTTTSSFLSPRSSILGSSSEDDSTLQAEEFDVGPSFVKRQQAEEEKWRRRLAGWNALLGHPDQALARRNDLRDLILRRV